jgi:hypothetical protein
MAREELEVVERLQKPAGGEDLKGPVDDPGFASE